jgi:hypothetical protein
MATLVLQTVGSVVGGAVGGPIGSVLGRLGGGVGGALIDQALQPRESPRYAIGPRLKAMDGIASIEGAAIPRVYGRARLGGQMIWATRFIEQTSVSLTGGGGGGKGVGGVAPSINVSYSYYANFAIGICQGPIAFVRRIWADGNELDMTTLPIRIYNGGEGQYPDPLIVAKEGAENTPAYRGLAYIVFEQQPLAHFGNRIPQFTFEVVKPVAGIGAMIRAVDLIPGATEAGYQPSLQLNFTSPGATNAENRHQMTAATDWTASLDALQALCPNLESVALVVAWFGDDLRAGSCTIAPRVDSLFKTIGEFDFVFGPFWPPDWSVAGLQRFNARLVSQINGRSAYGGTPSDASVSAAISDLKARGLSVVFYPFVMMDVPPNNALPNPYSGAAQQPAFPWRGRITCNPAPGRPGTPDGSAAAASEIAAFFAGYRSFILHYAQLCRGAGGVSAFLIGSELVGLTRVRSGPGHYPAVDALDSLATEVKTIVGAGTKLSYAADWTEYGAHVPADGELRFPLDPLWASSSIDFVGVDVYWPLSDWRDGPAHRDAALATTIYDVDYLAARMACGEAYDWYYADHAAREAQQRTPITDGLGKPWVFRQKDLASWWSNSHYERIGGAEMNSPTPWIAQSKPIWIVETGCPAVDRGANAPNVFPNAQSSEGGVPYFSRGGRDDLMQARYVEAALTHYDPASPGAHANNPISSVYGGSMVDPARIHIWCWDARPFPAFPTMSAIWADFDDWETGHWLNGRLEGTPLDRLVAELVSVVSTPHVRATRPEIYGFVDGYVLDRAMSPREAIEPLESLYGFDAVASGGQMRFVSRIGKIMREIGEDDLVPNKDGTLLSLRRAQESELPHEIALSFSDSERNYEIARVLSRRLEGYSLRQSEAQAAVAINRANAQRLATAWLQDLWIARETADFALRPGLAALEPGDLIRLNGAANGRLFQIRRITDGSTRRISARAVDPSVYDGAAPSVTRQPYAAPRIIGPPRVVALDLALARSDPTPLSYIAGFADPWPGALAIWRLVGGGYENFGLIEKRATIGDTIDVLRAGPVGRFDNGAGVTVRLGAGALASVDDASLFAGRATMAIRGPDGAWEIFAFSRAQLVADRTYRLSRLLRGIGGEDHLAKRDVPAGAPVVLLDDAIVPLAQDASMLDSPTTYRIGAVNRDYADPTYIQATFTPTRKALMPCAPTNARARRTPDGVVVSFIRRGRLDADPWEPIDIPLGEANEAYEIDVALPSNGNRLLAAKAPQVLYPVSVELADFGAAQSALSLCIYQISARVGRGFPLHATLMVS